MFSHSLVRSGHRVEDEEPCSIGVFSDVREARHLADLLNNVREHLFMKSSFLSLVFSAFLGFTAFALGEGFTLQDAAKMKQVLEVALSPDGRQVAYTLSVPRDPLKGDNGASWRELHVVNQQGQSRPFVRGKVSIGHITWAADSRSISYLAKRGDDKQTSLYSIPMDGGESQRVFEHETSISSYHWSGPDRFLFVATEKAADDKAEEKGFDAEVYEEEPRKGQVWIAERKGDTDEWDAKVIELDQAVFAARWSPDGQQLAVASAPQPFIDFYYMYQKIHVLDVARESVTAVLDHQGKLGSFRWSPNGRSIAFAGGAHLNDPSTGRLFVGDASTGRVKRLAEDYLPDFSALEWVNDEELIFVADAGCLTDYGRLNTVSGDWEILNFREAPVADALSYSVESERLAIAGSTPTHGSEVYSGRLNRRRVRRLTDSNPWLSERDIARQEVVHYQARDGVRVEGVLIYPTAYEPGTRYPLILAVHGGPESRVGNGWITSYSRPGQFAASAGYFVFYPNYRGSTGRGLEYAMSHQADYAGKEFDDLVDAIAYLDSRALIDPKKVGVTGGSYGGYASAWCATKLTEHFAASVMFVGISDLISKQGTTDIPDEMYLVHARKRPWDDWQFFLERSPIYHVEQANTPILILHGKEDPRVHPSQSLELYRTLKTIGKVPTRLVWYPGEGHGNRKAAARYDYSLRLMRWMDHYLKGPGGEPPAHPLDYGLEAEDTE